MSTSTFDVINARVGPGTGVAGRLLGTYPVTVTTTGATTDFTIAVPTGATWMHANVYVGTAASGAPTNANLTLGKTVGGAEYVPALDIKAQGRTAISVYATTAAADLLSLPGTTGDPRGNNTSTINGRLTFVAGTAPAMTFTVVVELGMPYTTPNEGRGL